MLLREIGRLVALLHDGGLIHGDLTTSNMLLRSPNKKLVVTAAADMSAPICVSACPCVQCEPCYPDTLLTTDEAPGRCILCLL